MTFDDMVNKLDAVATHLKYAKHLDELAGWVKKGIVIKTQYGSMDGYITAHVSGSDLDELKQKILESILREKNLNLEMAAEIAKELGITPEPPPEAESVLLAERPPFLKRVMD